MVGCHLHIFNKRGKPKAGHLQILTGMKAYSKKKDDKKTGSYSARARSISLKAS